MKVFLAGMSEVVHKGNGDEYYTLMKSRGVKVHELLSYLKAEQASIWKQAMALSEYRSEFFLDSGAYSAWTKGTLIDLDAYATFILDRADTFDVVANLDVIAGCKGRKPKSLEIEAAAEQGWKNYGWLQERFRAWEDSTGREIPFEFLHTYHQGEDVSWLERLLKQGDPYIAISPGNDRTTEDKMYWLDSIMPLLTDDKGWPIRKFHGFGVTALELLGRYPWYSVDSTSWVLTGRYGMVSIPIGDNVRNVVFSEQSPHAQYEGQHFKSFCTRDQDAIRAYLEEIGSDPKELAADYLARDHANILFWLNLEASWKPRPFERSRARLRFTL